MPNRGEALLCGELQVGANRGTGGRLSAKIERNYRARGRDTVVIDSLQSSMPLLILPVLFILALIVLIPISIVQRYRVGTSRQRARGWIAALNLGGLTLSAVLFVVSATFTNIWVPDALRYTVGGLAAGGLLGIVGL